MVGSPGDVVVAAGRFPEPAPPVPAGERGPQPRAQGDQGHGAGDQAGPRQDRPPQPPSRACGTPRPGRRGRRPPTPAGPAPAGPAGALRGRERGVGAVRCVLAHVVRELGLIRVVICPALRQPGAALVLADQGQGAGGQVGVAGPGAAGGPADERSQLGQQRRRGRAVPGAALQACRDDAGQVRRQAGKVGRLGGQPDQDVHHGVALIGRVPGRREQQRRAEREHVAGHRRLPGVPGLLGSHVRGCAQRAPGHGELDPLRGAGDPEIDDARAVRGDEHVGRLQVPVHQPRVVNRLQRLRAPGGEPAHRGYRQRAVVAHQPVQGRGRDVGGGQPGHVGVGVSRDDRRGEHAADAPRGGHLVSETGPETGFLGELDLDGLDRDQAARGGPAQVHLSHRPGTETSQEHERPYSFRIPSAQRR